MTDLKQKIGRDNETEAERILEQNIENERSYMQNQIIQIEMKQIAESITRVTHAKKLAVDPSVRKQTRGSDACEISKSSVGFLNRPFILSKLQSREK